MSILEIHGSMGTAAKIERGVVSGSCELSRIRYIMGLLNTSRVHSRFRMVIEG